MQTLKFILVHSYYFIDNYNRQSHVLLTLGYCNLHDNGKRYMYMYREQCKSKLNVYGKPCLSCFLFYVYLYA